ncbi:hypothetical protein LTR36_010193 [Oleoguttula mirabilis]|uniref:CREG-like beta-barrel domain-containing protein n=1 Tax=Oleoguttula mirabilis TaxID=1507867 RepID=A0AAV9JRP0_9PEZI|nr:hypothetical protein LTR36_010193 [Oleoguttula mirabilis]
MLLTLLPAALVSAATARSLAQPPILLQEPLHDQPAHDEAYHIPTLHESTVMARRIMHLSSISTLITTFPEPSRSDALQSSMARLSADEQVTVFENRPPEMAGTPIGLMEYYADCEPDTGNPTVLAINIATPYKNHAAGSNISMHVRWWPTQQNIYSTTSFSSSSEDDDDDDIPTPHTPAALPRFSLHGYLEPIPTLDLVTHLIPACFLRAHPDSVLWQPGNDIHTSQYMRFVVEHVYWFGGFGDRARIGWLPVEAWRNVTTDEVDSLRLPGERKHGKEECHKKEMEKEKARRQGWVHWLPSFGLADW